MSDRSPHLAAGRRPSLSRDLRMTLSYLALLVFTLFALAPLLRALETVGGGTIPVRLTSPSLSASAGHAALVALALAIAGTALSSFIGFASSRRHGRSTVVGRSPLPQIVPALVLLLPLGFVLYAIGEALPALWVAAIYLVTTLPVVSWQLGRAYDSVSPSVEEAALLEGCGSWRVFYSVLAPAILPALILSAIFSFVIAWNDYFVITTLPASAALARLWSWYSLGTLLVALLLGFALWAFGRSRAAHS